jgi:hypothetical protein
LRTVQVKGSDLTRVLVNIDLWLVSGYLHVDEDGIRGYSTDGFVACADVAELQGKSDDWMPGDEYLYEVTADDIDHLLLITRKVGQKPVEVIFTETCLTVDGFDFVNEGTDDKPKWVLDVNPEAESSFGIGKVDMPEWVHLLLDSVTNIEEKCPVTNLAFRAERFLKLSRVRSDNLAPIDMVLVPPLNSEAGPMVLVRIGDTFRALVNSVNREVAIANQPDDRGWFWT